MENESKALSKVGQKAEMVEVRNSASTGLQDLKSLVNFAKLIAPSEIIPKAYHNKPENCLIAVETAIRLNTSFLMVMQNLYIVYGNPAWSSKFLIACFNQCGRFSALKYEFSGEEYTDKWGCRAYATELSSGEKLYGTKVTIKMAKDEKWYQKDGSKWQTMPEKMLKYRSASFFINECAPEISLGFQTKDELEDTITLSKGVDGSYNSVQAQVEKEQASEPAPEMPQTKAPENEEAPF